MKSSYVRATSSDNHPEFFKVFLPSFSSYQMEIPPAFINYFKGNLPSKVVLKNYTGKSWHVTFKELDGEYFFVNGWQAFVDGHLLEYGDFLIFQYLGNFVFNVKIFGKNGCTKNFMETADHLVSRVTIKDEPDIGQTKTRLTVGHFVPVAAIKDKFDFDQTETNTTGSSGQKLSGAKGCPGRPKKRAPKFLPCPSKPQVTKNDSSKYPFFEFIVTSWTLYKVHIPRSLTNEYNLTISPNFVLEDQRGKQWPVRLVYRDGRVTLGRGWLDCGASNDVKVGDKCRIELVLNRRNRCDKMNMKIIRNRNHGYALRKRGV